MAIRAYLDTSLQATPSAIAKLRQSALARQSNQYAASRSSFNAEQTLETGKN
jgi:hypothetical protein